MQLLHALFKVCFRPKQIFISNALCSCRLIKCHLNYTSALFVVFKIFLYSAFFVILIFNFFLSYMKLI